jgi:hypothetical protein
VLRDRQGDAGDIHFLEGVRSKHAGVDLARDGHQGDGIHHGCGQACDQIGGPWTGSGNDDPSASGGAGVSVRHVGRALFVASQDVADGTIN